jgi:predicted aconitase
VTAPVRELDDGDRALLDGARGPAMQLAMRLVLRAAEIMGAERLIPVTFAHIDSCFYVGQAHVDFAEYLLANGATLAVPAWTNNGVVSLGDAGLRPEADNPERVAGARRLMEIYRALGCRPVWTCAPYQLPGGPAFADHIVAAESNAVTYYNSVVGARTNKYGDYLDVACALVGKAPYAGFHLDAARRGDILFDVSDIPDRLRGEGIFHHLLGHHVGRRAGRQVPVIAGLSPEATRDDLKAVSAAVAASGGVEMWHGLGLTPEARDAEQAFGGRAPAERHRVTLDDLRRAMAELSTGRDGPLEMVALGTPHFSPTEIAALVSLLDGRRVKPGLALYVSTSRFVRDLVAGRGDIAALEAAGATVVVDTCTYFSPAVRGARGRVMTNAAKWAYYAPGQLGVETVFGSLRECVESAVAGEVWRDPGLWPGR